MTKFEVFIKNTKKFAKHYSPEICTTIGILGLLSAQVITGKAALKAEKIINKRKKEKKVEKLTRLETIECCWTTYAPSALISIASVGAIIGGAKINFSRRMALASAYTIAQQSLLEYKNSAKEALGEEMEMMLTDQVNKKAIDNTPIPDNIKNSMDSNGEDSSGNNIIFEPITARYFKSSKNKIDAAVNELNALAISSGDAIYLNEFFDLIGLDNALIGEYMAWYFDPDAMYKHGPIIIEYDAVLKDDSYPCLAISYSTFPKPCGYM